MYGIMPGASSLLHIGMRWPAVSCLCVVCAATAGALCSTPAPAVAQPPAYSASKPVAEKKPVPPPLPAGKHGGG
jgi:hypothetical protein